MMRNIMEAWAYVICWDLVLVTSVVATGQLIVPGVTIGELEHSVTLRCRLETADPWYVISWSRLSDNGTETILVRLPSGHMVPDWNPEVTSVGSRFQPLITVQARLVEFNLVINPSTCGDMGTYRCRGVYASGDSSEVTDLQLRQPPGMPHVTYEHEAEGHRRGTWRLHCHADAGLPPQEFLWYVKAPRMRHFQIAEGQAEAEYFSDHSCKVTSRRSLSVSLASEARGTMYRCALPGRVEEERYFDEVTVEQLPSVIEEDAAGDDTSCMGNNCLLQAETKPLSNSGRLKAHCMSASVIGLGAVICYLVGRTLSPFSLYG